MSEASLVEDSAAARGGVRRGYRRLGSVALEREFDRLRLSTAGAGSWLSIDYHLPHTVRTALPSRPVQALLAHPLLDCRACTVLRVEPDVAGRFGTVIHVRTRLRRYGTPWTAAEALGAGAAEMAGLIGEDRA